MVISRLLVVSALAFASIMLDSRGVAAQDQERLVPLRVTIMTRSGTTLTGALREEPGDSVLLDLQFRRHARVAVSDIEQSWRSLGVDRWRGARRGAVVGFVLGAGLLGITMWDDAHRTGSDNFMLASYYYAPVAAGLPIAGAVTGALLARERWAVYALPKQPANGGGVLGVSLYARWAPR